MATAWSYPWRLLSETRTRPVSDLPAAGIDGLAVASHYHSVRTLCPGGDDDPFASYPGGCFFEPSDRFDDSPITPPVRDVRGRTDALGALAAHPAAGSLDLTAWLVCLHNTRLGSANPAYRIESAFGHEHDHALCPSHPEVRRYFASVAADLREYDVEAIGLESIGFPSAFHGHGDGFGHEKNQAIASTAEELLFSQCFCDACRGRADFAIDAARDVVRDRCTRTLTTPGATVSSLDALVAEYPILDDLFAFRAEVVESLVRGIAAASGDVSVTYYASAGAGRDPDDGWPAGVRLDRLSDHLDRVTALCYTGDPARARRRVEAFQDAAAVTVDVGVSLAPEFVATREEWDALLRAVREPLEGELLIYNESLLTETHFDWLEATLAGDAGGAPAE